MTVPPGPSFLRQLNFQAFEKVTGDDIVEESWIDIILRLKENGFSDSDSENEEADIASLC